MGISITTETYVDFDASYISTQIPFTDSWEKSKGASYFIDLALFEEKFKENDEVTKINDTRYKVKLTKQLLLSCQIMIAVWEIMI